MHVQRHVTVENFMDCLAFKQYYDGQSINMTLFDKLGLLEALPLEIGDLIHKSFHNTYDNIDDHPNRLPGGGFLSRQLVVRTCIYPICYPMKYCLCHS